MDFLTLLINRDSHKLTRRATYPTKFTSIDLYRQALLCALEEDILAYCDSISNKFQSPNAYLFASKKKNVFLTLPTPPKTMRQGDLWFCYGSHKRAWVLKNEWAGLGKNNQVEMSVLKGGLKGISTRFKDPSSVQVVHVPGTSTRLDMYRNLLEGEARVLNTLATLTPSRVQVPRLVPGALGIIQAKILQFGLNKQQSMVLHQVCGCFVESSLDTHLVHGVFGSGKTTLICAIVLTIHALVRECPQPVKILLGASTNAAVDHVLLTLLDKHAFSSLARVGSKAMHKRLLKFPLDKAKLVCGVTCCSSVNPSIKDMFQNTFTITLLDESSQMTEPLALLPILQSRTSLLVLVGDPKQLSPVSVMESQPTSSSTTSSPNKTDLSMTLFERLFYHIPPTLLHTQYRCALPLSNLASKHFYNNQVICGVDPNRARFNIPTMSRVVVNQSATSRFGSWVNVLEAKAVCKVVEYLKELGVDVVKDVAVICLYKAQVKEVLSHVPAGLEVNTVDAFQGKEKEVVVLSTVHHACTSFKEDQRRMCVLITRARSHLVVLGAQSSPYSKGVWKELWDASKVLKV